MVLSQINLWIMALYPSGTVTAGLKAHYLIVMLNSIRSTFEFHHEECH